MLHLEMGQIQLTEKLAIKPELSYLLISNAPHYWIGGTALAGLWCFQFIYLNGMGL